MINILINMPEFESKLPHNFSSTKKYPEVELSTDEICEIFKDFPINILEKFCKIRNDKHKFVKDQKFQEAGDLRDMEKVMIKQYPDLLLVKFNWEEWLIRELKIRKIVE